MSTTACNYLSTLGLLLSLTGAGCASTPAGGESESSTASSSVGGGEGETGDPSECPMEFDEAVPGATELPPPFANCELPTPCGQVVFEMVGSGGTDGGDENQTPGALQCVLDELASGEPGQFDLNASASGFSAEVQIRVYGQQRAEWSYLGFDDKSFRQSRKAAKIDPNYFVNETCNATTTWFGVWNCIEQGLATCETWADSTELCP